MKKKESKIELPEDGAVRTNDKSSPSGLSIWKLGQWVPLTYAVEKKKKKKKKKTLNYEPDYNKINEENERQKRIEEISKHNELMHSIVAGHPELIVIESGYGYSIIIIKRLINIQINIEKGAGFQPYETVNKKSMHVVNMLRWGTPDKWGFIGETLIKNHIDSVHVITNVDVEDFIKQG